MANDSLRDYWFNKLLAPKSVIINKPGVIYSVLSKKYVGSEIKKRIIWVFEDNLVNLQLETVNYFGEKQASKILYNLGREIGMAYLLLSNVKKPPSFLLPSIINYVTKNLEGSGLGLPLYKYDNKKKIIILKGEDIPIIRKSKNHSTLLGLYSTVFSFLTDKNLNGDVKDLKETKSYLYIFNEKIKEKDSKFILDREKIKPINNYESLNFPSEKVFLENAVTFSELLKFGKLKLKERGRFYFKDKLILVSSTEFLNIIANFYLRENKRDLLEKAIVSEARELAKHLLKDQKMVDKKIKFIMNMLSCFGWGIPRYRKIERGCVIEFIHPPISKYGFLYEALILKGYLEQIFNKKFIIESICRNNKPCKIEVCYKISNKI